MKTLVPSIYTGTRSLVGTVVSGFRTLPPTVFTGPVLWTNPDNGLWVATSSDGFLGMVEEIGSRYRSTNPLGLTIGTYDSLDLARDVIATSTVEPGMKVERRFALVLTAAIAGAGVVLAGAVTIWVSTR